MVDIASFRFNDPGKAFDAGYGRVNALRTDRARMTAGNALSGGDYGGAANALYGAGELEAGARVQGMGESRQAITAKVAKDRKAETIAAWGEAAGRLQTIRERDQNPNAVVAGFDQFFAPRLQQLGETPENIAQARNLLATDPDNTLLALGAGAAKKLGYDTAVVGEELIVTDKATGKVVGRYRGKRTVNVPEGGALYELGGDGAGAQAPAAQPNAAVAPAAPAGGSVEEMQTTLSSVLPGARFTSGRRTPEHNRKVGGAPNSYHLKGQALDIVPPAGMTTAQAAATIRASGQYAEVIDEGDHVHVAWGGGGSAPAPLAGGSGQDRVADGGPKLLVSRPKAAKEVARPATAAEKAAFGIPESTPAQMKPDGTLDVITLPKGTADVEKAQRAVEAQVLKAQDIISTVNSARGKVNNLTAGFVGGNINGIAGTPAYDLAREIDTIKANLGFQELAAMRAASPTGGALGAIAVQELVALQSTVASLDIGQSPAQLRGSLDKIQQHYSRWIKAVEDQAKGDAPAVAAQPAKPAGAPKRLRFDTQGNVIQ